MTQEFRAAKNVIRSAVAAAPRPTVESILEAAREGRVPYMGTVSSLGLGQPHGSLVSHCGCVSQRLDRKMADYNPRVSDAYRSIGGDCFDIGSHINDPRRQRILVAICRADLRRRDREIVKALVESAHEQEAACVR